MIAFLRHIIQGYKKNVFYLTLIGIFDVAFSLAFVWFSKTVIDVATGVREGSLYHYGTLLVVLISFQIVLRIIDVRLENMTEVRMGNSIRHKLFSHLMYTRWSELSSMHSGDVLTRMIRDTDDVVKVFTTVIPMFISAILQLVGAVILLSIFDLTLALILGIAIPLVALFSRLYYVRMRKYTLQVKESESQITSMVEESIQNQLVIRTFERQEANLEKLGMLQDELYAKVGRRTNVSVFANAIMNVAFHGGYITAFLWGAYGLAKKTITYGTVTAYLQLVARIQRPVFDLMRLLPTVIAAKAAVERLQSMTKFELEDKRKKIFLQGPAALKIEGLTFSYSPDDKPVIQNFSMAAAPGSMTAIMGETGAGKTTLLRLLLGLVKPNSGTIVLESGRQAVPVSENTRGNFVYVPQGGSLFSGTIRENLQIGNPKADEALMRHALSVASAEFVFALPQGLDTVLAQDGAGLSEGQAQRIAIARAFLRPGKIMLLDESTSALDAETEKKFLLRLKQEMGDKVVVFITHHAEVAAQCDWVVKI